MSHPEFLLWEGKRKEWPKMQRLLRAWKIEPSIPDTYDEYLEQLESIRRMVFANSDGRVRFVVSRVSATWIEKERKERKLRRNPQSFMLIMKSPIGDINLDKFKLPRSAIKTGLQHKAG